MQREWRVGLLLLVFALAVGVVSGSGAMAGPSTADSRNAIFTDIDNATLKRLASQGVPIVDIRRPDEWKETGVIAGSRLITLFTDGRGSVNPQFMPGFSKMVSPGDAVVVVCRTGNRSAFLADALARQMGYSKIYNLTHGIVGWIGAGNAVVAPR